MAREDLHFRLRIPEDLKQKIQEAAEANRRSMTAEIVARLEQSFLQAPLPLAGLDDLDSLPPEEAFQLAQQYNLKANQALWDTIQRLSAKLKTQVIEEARPTKPTSHLKDVEVSPKPKSRLKDV